MRDIRGKKIFWGYTEKFVLTGGGAQWYGIDRRAKRGGCFREFNVSRGRGRNMPQDELKVIQKKYLHYVYRYETDGPKHFDPAADLGADRRSAGRMLASLAAQGFLHADGEVYRLSERGRAALSPQLGQAEIVRLWLRRSGFDKETVRREAFHMLLGLAPGMAAWLISEGLFWFVMLGAGAMTREGRSMFAGARWKVNVSLFKPDGSASMGGRGIRDCFVVLRSGRLYLEFHSRFMRYPAGGGATVKGKLTRLWYRPCGSDLWREVVSRRSVWRIPLADTALSFEEGVLQARTRIRALAEEHCGMSGNEEADLVCTVWFDEIFLPNG
jgi:Mn-dependent DtxR family transcriptional regulator